MRRILAAAIWLGMAASAHALPDIVPTGATLDAQNRLIVTLENQGATAVPTTSGASLSIYIDGRAVGAYQFDRLADTAWRAPGGRLAIPTNFRLRGDNRRVAIVVDPGNRLPEANERQNTLTRMIVAPTLTGADFEVASISQALVSRQLQIRVRNAGTAPARASQRLNIRIIIDERVERDMTEIVSGLAPGAVRTIALIDPPVISGRQRVRVLITTPNFADDLDSTNNVREQILPLADISAYHTLLATPRIRDAIIWAGLTGGVRNYAAWTAAERTALDAALIELENGRDPGLLAPPTPPPGRDHGFTAADAWRIYISYVAHALWVERTRAVSWRLADLSPAHLAFLLDSRNIFSAISPASGERYFAFNALEHGNSTAYNPRIAWQFMASLGLVRARPDETLYAAAEWMRDHLRHITAGEDARAIFDYPPAHPPFDRILYPLPGQMHITIGCGGTAPLFVALMRSANIPARHAHWRIAGGHRRAEFPALGLTMVHADDVHSQVMKPTGHIPPIRGIFVALSAYESRFERPTLDCAAGRCNTGDEQARYNNERDTLERARAVTGDYLLYDYARNGADALDRTLRGVERDGTTLTFARPFFTDAERAATRTAVEAELRRIGGGDLAAGGALVIDRVERYNATINRVAP